MYLRVVYLRVYRVVYLRVVYLRVYMEVYLRVVYLRVYMGGIQGGYTRVGSMGGIQGGYTRVGMVGKHWVCNTLRMSRFLGSREPRNITRFTVGRQFLLPYPALLSLFTVAS